MTNSALKREKFSQGKWTIYVYDNGYSFFCGGDFTADYFRKAAEYIDELILKRNVLSWPWRVVSALPVGMRIPAKLARDVHRHVRATCEWKD